MGISYIQLSRLLVATLLFFANAQTYAACVQVRSTKLYAKPSLTSKKTWEASIYTPLKIKKMQGLWIFVSDIDSHSHWVEMKSLSKDLNCASVKAQKSSLYKKENEAYQEISDLPLVKRTSFKLLSQNKDWLELQDAQGNTYYGKTNDFWISSEAKPAVASPNH